MLKSIFVLMGLVLLTGCLRSDEPLVIDSGHISPTVYDSAVSNTQWKIEQMRLVSHRGIPFTSTDAEPKKAQIAFTKNEETQTLVLDAENVDTGGLTHEAVGYEILGREVLLYSIGIESTESKPFLLQAGSTWTIRDMSEHEMILRLVNGETTIDFKLSKIKE